MNTVAPITPEQITIAVTVYSRRQYIKQAVASALQQTRPVRVMVVEDCGPDPALQDFVKREFGDGIEYIRNPQRRGLFGNWNACLDNCKTPWVSILHDDDYLAPNFVESMITLSERIPGCGLYFGAFHVVYETGERAPEWDKPPIAVPWRNVPLEELYVGTPFAFAGQLFRVDRARQLGNFRVTSQYAGDWEMWAKLTAYFGAAETQEHVAYTRGHRGFDRGSNVVRRSGRIPALTYVQRKRVLALLRQRGVALHIDRRRDQQWVPIASRDLLECGNSISPRLLRYNLALLKLSPSPTWGHALFKFSSSIFGPGFVKWASRLWTWALARETRSGPQGVNMLKPVR
jgi:glycosyltransferase involved in cell wall biosynthesis